MPLTEVIRGGLVESLHLGAVAVVDAQDRLVARAGSPDLVAYLRSTAKPLQALALVESGAADAFGLDEPAIAIACGSHSGSDAHATLVRSMLARLGLDESALRCGTHPPGDRAAREMLRLTGAEPAPAQHNCSGKHSGMLAVAQLRGAPLETYLHPDHPVQQHIRRALGEMAGLAPEAIGVAVDGCSAPTFAIPLRATALAFARLMDPDGLPASRALACRRIVAAMQAHPVMVSGDGELDTAVLRALAGRLIIKGGAEGYCGIGLAPGASGPGSPALGVAFKIIDGNGPRARGPVTIEILRQLGVCPDVPPALAEFHHTPVKNYRGTVTGEVRPVVQLTRLAG